MHPEAPVQYPPVEATNTYQRGVYYTEVDQCIASAFLSIPSLCTSLHNLLAQQDMLLFNSLADLVDTIYGKEYSFNEFYYAQVSFEGGKQVEFKILKRRYNHNGTDLFSILIYDIEKPENFNMYIYDNHLEAHIEQDIFRLYFQRMNQLEHSESKEVRVETFVSVVRELYGDDVGDFYQRYFEMIYEERELFDGATHIAYNS